MSNFLLQGTSAEEFSNSIVSEIDARFKKLENRITSNQPPKLLTRKKTAEMLNVDLSTLHNWNKQGILKPYQIGGRVFYRLQDIENALTLLKN